MVIDYQELLGKLANFTSSPTMLDARPSGRFSGQDPEPRPGISSGHAPGSINLPFSELLSNGRMLSKEELLKVFERRRIDLDGELITSCGSGVTAAIIYLALDVVGKKNVRLYDGSWAEYASLRSSPIQRNI